MINNKPFFISALCFGGVGFLFLVIALAAVLTNDTTIKEFVVEKFCLEPESFTNATIAQFGIILFIPAYFFGSSCISDDGKETITKITQ